MAHQAKPLPVQNTDLGAHSSLSHSTSHPALCIQAGEVEEAPGFWLWIGLVPALAAICGRVNQGMEDISLHLPATLPFK